MRPDQVDTLLDYIEDYVIEIILSARYGERTIKLMSKRDVVRDYIMTLFGEE